jgi:hypothetical protein
MMPIVGLLSLLIVVVLCTIYSLALDLLDKGCLAWHRDAIGYFVQTLICFICLLITACRLMLYIEDYEENKAATIKSKQTKCISVLSYHFSRVLGTTIMLSFTPLLVFSSLYLLKLVCFKSKNTPIQVAISLSLISSAFAFESRFDN